MTSFGKRAATMILALAFGALLPTSAVADDPKDILIILNRDYDWEYKKEIISVVCDVELEYDIFIDTKIISNHELYYTIKGKNPLYADALREGIPA